MSNSLDTSKFIFKRKHDKKKERKSKTFRDLLNDDDVINIRKSSNQELDILILSNIIEVPLDVINEAKANS